MNSPITFPPAAPVLKLARPSAEKWAATLAEERRRLQEDHDALREREANLRDYEARLRNLQAEIEAGRATAAPASRATTGRATVSPFRVSASRTPFTDDPALAAGWEKLHRARELLEVEQLHLRDERIMMQDQVEALKQRETRVIEREIQVAQRESLLAGVPDPEPEPIAGEHTISAMTRLTTAPFRMARSVLRGKNKPA